MTIKDCIDIVDKNKPNQYTIKEKVMWISFIEGIIINEVLKTHEGYDGRYDDFEGYSEDKLSVTLIVPSPYDRLYTAYLKMMIDKENGETARYNNSAASYNTYMDEYRRHYNKTHMPLNIVGRRNVMPPKKATIGLSDAEYENLKKDLTYILTEFFSASVSEDKLYDIVMKYVQTNAEMLKGKPGEDGIPGYSPIKGVDYYTEEEIKGIIADIVSKIDKKSLGLDRVDNTSDREKHVAYANESNYADVAIRADVADTAYRDRNFREITEYYAPKKEVTIIKSDLEGLQQRINEEAHFRGYMSTNDKICLMVATPNDFAYSAESGTKWVYDELLGWIDTNTPVPDQLTPASDATPLINGTASSGTATEYSRGDHRHPTDTTRVSVDEFNAFKSELETGLDNIIAIQNTLIGGGSV